jgi:hypothetical protein
MRSWPVNPKFRSASCICFKIADAICLKFATVSHALFLILFAAVWAIVILYGPESFAGAIDCPNLSGLYEVSNGSAFEGSCAVYKQYRIYQSTCRDLDIEAVTSGEPVAGLRSDADTATVSFVHIEEKGKRRYSKGIWGYYYMKPFWIVDKSKRVTGLVQGNYLVDEQTGKRETDMLWELSFADFERDGSIVFKIDAMKSALANDTCRTRLVLTPN